GHDLTANPVRAEAAVLITGDLSSPTPSLGFSSEVESPRLEGGKATSGIGSGSGSDELTRVGCVPAHESHGFSAPSSLPSSRSKAGDRRLFCITELFNRGFPAVSGHRFLLNFWPDAA